VQKSRLWFNLLMLALACSWTSAARAQTCLTSGDMDDATRNAIQATAKRYFDMAARGDTATLQQSAIASLGSNFSGVESAVKDNQANFAGAQATPRPPFLLKTEGTAPLERAEFLCGVFGKSGQTENSSVFVIPNLPPGSYAVETLDVAAKNASTVTMVLQHQGMDWKLAGFDVRESQVAGHDAKWFADQARQYKAKGQTHNAWFYFIEARHLSVPVNFMNTMATDKLYDEAQNTKPSDVPVEDPVDLTLGGKSYKITQMFPLTVGNDLDVVVKYQVPDVSNTAQTFQENIAVMKGLAAKYPELRNAFAGIVARAVAPSGQDYGTMLPMKEIK